MTPAPPLAVPLPFVTALLIAALALRVATSSAVNRPGRAVFTALFAVLGLQALLVGLRFGYGVEGAIPVQRVLPFAVGPLAFLGFRALAVPPDRAVSGLAPHAAAALAAIGVFLIVPPAFAWGDTAIGLSFLVYTALLVRLYRRGPDGFEIAHLSEVGAIRRWLLAAIVLLVFTIVLDGLIALDFALASGRGAASLIALGSLLLILALVAATILAPRGGPDRETPARPPAPATASTAEDRVLLDRIETLFATTRLYRDHDLTLARLARRLGVPARRLSEVVNRTHGLNLSQFVNNHRIKDAANLLTDTSTTVADIMTTVGFRTKSNFYREFHRLHGVSPMDYRQGVGMSLP